MGKDLSWWLSLGCISLKWMITNKKWFNNNVFYFYYTFINIDYIHIAKISLNYNYLLKKLIKVWLKQLNCLLPLLYWSLLEKMFNFHPDQLNKIKFHNNKPIYPVYQN